MEIPDRPSSLVFASGTPKDGGSGFKVLVNASRDGRLKTKIVGVVSNHENGGVRQKADELGIPFYYAPSAEWNHAAKYHEVARKFGADFFLLSGWLRLVVGLDHNTRFNPRNIINIHPGPMEFGGPGMYGHKVHEAVMKAYHEGKITHTAVSMHFVTAKYDDPIGLFLDFKIKIQKDDTAETLGKRVNKWEHLLQPTVTNMVVSGKIYWNGRDPSTLVVPDDYQIHQSD